MISMFYIYLPVCGALAAGSGDGMDHSCGWGIDAGTIGAGPSPLKLTRMIAQEIEHPLSDKNKFQIMLKTSPLFMHCYYKLYHVKQI